MKPEDPDFMKHWNAIRLALRTRRLERKLTQTDVANSLRMKPPTINRIENGEMIASTSTLFKLARFYGCTIQLG